MHDLHLAIIQQNLACEYFHQRGFSGAITPNQTHSFIFL
ncbi:Uncharacterised protein [Vibrio cholerae]|nr:Uncharacterised protein [Vibrio cholerae]